MKALEKVLETLAVGLLRGYQWLIRPILPMSCRFWPSCSNYAIEAVRRHGVVRGGGLSIWRLLRCNPWGGSGIDPVPPCSHRPALTPDRMETAEPQTRI